MKKFKIEFKEYGGGGANNYYLCKMKSAAEIMAAGNSERFSGIIADKWVLVDNYNSNRVKNAMNPHIESELNAAAIRNYRIDNLRTAAAEIKTILVKNLYYAIYSVDFESGEASVFIPAGSVICKTCGAIIKKAERVGMLCEKCLTDENGLAYRFSYHGYYGGYECSERVKEKTPIFGCEIERDYRAVNDGDEFDFMLKRTLIDASKIIYGDKLTNSRRVADIKREAVFMYDGSLRNGGVEWITMPHTLKHYQEQAATINAVLEMMKERGFKNTEYAGNHIHINRSYFGTDAKYCAAKMAILLNSDWNEWLAVAGRERTGYACKPRQNKNDNLFDLVEKTIQDSGEHSNAINLQHRNTIEVRIWSGINSADDLLFYLNCTLALAKFAKNSLEKVQRSNIIDVLKLLKNKTYIREAADRLEEKGYNEHAKELRDYAETITETEEQEEN
jgi:hypothetical protein